MTHRKIPSADGTNIAFEEAGKKGAQSILFVHGIAQSRGSWKSVFDGPLAKDFHLVALDLRGHGDSDAPADDAAYTGGAHLGNDLKAVMDTLGLVKPIIVAWSYGGVVTGEYLRSHGDAALGGILFAAAAVRVGKPAKGLLGPVMLENGRALMSDDAAIYEAGSRTFMAGGTAKPLSEEIFERAIADMKRVPAHARRALLMRSEDFGPELEKVAIPTAVVHGTADRVVLPAMSGYIHSTIQSSELSSLDDIGHVPWDESPESFERALRRLAARVTSGGALA